MHHWLNPDDAYPEIIWNLSGIEVEAESFRRIETERGATKLSDAEWKVARRIVHATADFAILESLRFNYDPIMRCLEALRAGAPIFCDSTMIKSGLSAAKLKNFNASYSKESILCHIADPDVAETASTLGITRALASVMKAEEKLRGSIVLIGNAPLALAGVARLCLERDIRPAVVFGMPVGFVNVVESKRLLDKTNLPRIVVDDRRGGSAMAVATLHGVMDAAG
jgi:precorrin isomerase